MSLEGTQKDNATSQELSKARPEYQRLEALLGKLNFFRAAGVHRAELRHSDFLKFLLSPHESHRIGDAFLKDWLKRCLRRATTPQPITAEDVDLLDLHACKTCREVDHIDVSVVSEAANLGVIVENKVDSGEHDDQLRRYWEAFHKRYPKVTRVISLFLSPRGTNPTDARYIPVSYASVADSVDAIREKLGSDLGKDLKVLLRHYSDLLRSEFMTDQKAAEVAWSIHRQFDHAVEFVANNSPIVQVRAELKRLINETKDVSYKTENSHEIWFTLPDWSRNNVTADPSGKSVGWLFWFDFGREIILWLGANPEVEAACKSLLRAGDSNRTLFRDIDHAGKKTGDWPTIWSKKFITLDGVSRLERDAVMRALNKRWKIFCDKDLPNIRAALAPVFE